MAVKAPELDTLTDDAQRYVPARISFQKERLPKQRPTNPMGRLNGRIRRRTDIVGIFPNDDATVRLVGAPPPERNHERAVQRGRRMTRETIAPTGDDPVTIPPAATS